MRRRATRGGGRRATWLLPGLACLLVVAPLAAAPRAEPGTCPSYRFMPGVGKACRGDDGMLHVLLPDGTVLLSHGPDPVAAAGSTASAPARPPSCVSGAPGDFYVVPIYARAIDDTDDYAARASTIRSVIQQADGLVDASAAAVGRTADLKVLCASGAIAVANVTLPTPKNSTDFSTITSDLRRAGYNNVRAKYWVYFDERTACGCAGMANLSNDDRLSADNRNNGNNSEPMFAITFGYLTPSTMLHELAHTMGAVQDSAPHSTDAGHCTDGRDVMCYNDGGAKGRFYTTSRCSTEAFDCGRDDYFNPNPAAGSYLASHWNLGSRLNRFLAFDPGGAPVMNALVCPGKAGLRRAYVCAFRAADTSAGVAYVVGWGDGTPAQRIPRTGFAPQGTYQQAAHSYTSTRTFSMTVYAVDSGKPARRSRTMNAPIQVVNDRTPPSLTILDPAPGSLYKGCDVEGAYTPGRAAIAQRACLVTRTSDAGTGVAGIWIYVNGRAAGWTRSPRVEFNVRGPATNVPVRVEVRDFAGNVTVRTVVVDILA